VDQISVIGFEKGAEVLVTDGLRPWWNWTMLVGRNGRFKRYEAHSCSMCRVDYGCSCRYPSLNMLDIFVW